MTSATTATGGLAERYATALFELADDERAADKVADELHNLQAMINGSADLRRLIASPVIDRDDQSRAMSAILTKAEFSDLTIRFVGVVTAKRRLFALPNMIRAYGAKIAQRRGESTAEVVSAKALTKAQTAALMEALQKAAGTDVALNQRVDPDILGGLVIKIGSKMIDSSLRTKLNRLSLAIKGIG